MPYFTTGNSENEQTAPLKEENGYATISLPDAGYGFSHLPYGYLNSQRKENLLIHALSTKSIHTRSNVLKYGTAHPGNRQDDPQCRR